MTAYYNEWEPYPAQWLRNLIAANLIAPGEVDERSIKDVKADDLKGFTQCHFFAGIGGWSYALRLALWPDDRPVWTGSCPCQPFSAAGKRKGFEDERHLWPTWRSLIAECRPTTVFGEQVASAQVWFDRVCDDMESEDYAIGAAILPACAVDAPHRRDRLWFVADADFDFRDKWRQGDADKGARWGNADRGPISASMADAASEGSLPAAQSRLHRGEAGDGTRYAQSERPGFATLADADRSNSFWWSGPLQVGRNAIQGKATAGGDFCGTQWRVEPGVPLLAHGISSRTSKLSAYGNAIVPQVAQAFIEAFMECRP